MKSFLASRLLADAANSCSQETSDRHQMDRRIIKSQGGFEAQRGFQQIQRIISRLSGHLLFLEYIQKEAGTRTGIPQESIACRRRTVAMATIVPSLMTLSMI